MGTAPGTGGVAPPIFEREQALAAIDEALSQAASDAGRLLLVEGPAGIGKSRLLAEARVRARAAGFRELYARGDELEREFASGVVTQLFARTVQEAPATERERLATLLPPSAAALFGLRPAQPELEAAGEFALLHGLFSLACELAEAQPLAVIVDDAHWADIPSLRWLAYLAARYENLPVAVIVASRTGPQDEAAELVARLGAAGGAHVEQLGPLGHEAIAAMVRDELGAEASHGVCAACAQLTSGNPFYVHELLTTLRRDGIAVTDLAPDQILAVAPSSLARAVFARFGRLPSGAIDLARAVAILGSDVELRHAAALAQIDTLRALELLDLLSSAEILEPAEPLRFVHPLVAHAVAADMQPGARAALHLRAAELLAADGAPVERVAAQLMDAPRRGDQTAVEALRAAAQRSRSRGGNASAARLLERALAEPPVLERRAEILVELGQAEAAAGLPSAPERLAAALELTDAHMLRAEIEQARGHALYLQGRHGEAAAAFEAAISELEQEPDGEAAAGRAEMRSGLEAAYVAAATIDPLLRSEALARADALVAEFRGALTAGQRAILAQAALHHCLSGAEGGLVRGLALRAWDEGRLLEDETAAGLNWTLVTGALDFTDDLEHALVVCEAALADAHRLGSPMAHATASYERSTPLYHMGRIAEAAADAQEAVDAAGYGWEMYARSAAYTLALCQIELGELDAAEATLSVLDREEPGSSIEHPALLDARGVLRLRRGRPHEALADHLEAGRLFTEVFGVMTTGDVDWRLGAAEAALVAGHRARAVELASEGLEFARSTGITRGVVGALRVLGLALGGEAGLERLRKATDQPHPAGDRLEHMRALVDLGAALRRANRRQEAQEPLRRAIHLATLRGATALAERALTELRATGARPRRTFLTGLEALTPSERRIAGLAAQGATNREIAQSLFVTPKTVEYHLKHVFQKLEVRSRRELAPLLSAAADGVGVE